jgi:hypothetical protein
MLNTDNIKYEFKKDIYDILTKNYNLKINFRYHDHIKQIQEFGKHALLNSLFD